MSPATLFKYTTFKEIQTGETVPVKKENWIKCKTNYNYSRQLRLLTPCQGRKSR
jgi:hypothetical protein